MVDVVICFNLIVINTKKRDINIVQKYGNTVTIAILVTTQHSAKFRSHRIAIHNGRIAKVFKITKLFSAL